MYSAKYNFGAVDKVATEALGVPGKRIFRILVDGPSPAAATLWVEKEQVYGLSMAMKKMLEGGAEGGPGDKEGGSEYPEMAEERPSVEGDSREVLEFRVTRLGLAFGPGKDYISVFFHDARDEPEEEGPGGGEAGEAGDEESSAPPKLQVCLTRAQAEAFLRQSLDECASGRGTDAMSRHALVATGKVDPNKNGHFRH